MQNKGVNYSKRIEYIDAMRGFTMFLVVMGHCVSFLFPQTDGNVYIEIFNSFRMPLFFFISGFVFYKSSRVWDKQSIKEFFKKKLCVQVVSPLIFFCLFIYLFDFPLILSCFDVNKLGFWFTFALFEYFILYVLCCKFSSVFGLSSKGQDILLITVSVIILLLLNDHITSRFSTYSLFNLLSVAKINLFIFFVFGTLAKKYFEKFEEMLDNTNCVLYAIVVFVLLTVFREFLLLPGVNLITVTMKGIAGVIITFAFFRRHQNFFAQNNIIGAAMQGVGRRTLDIYLLHYFVLPRGIMGIPEFLTNTSLMLFFTASAIAILIIGVCLLISSVLRLHPLLEYYLFGIKRGR